MAAHLLLWRAEAADSGAGNQHSHSPIHHLLQAGRLCSLRLPGKLRMHKRLSLMKSYSLRGMNHVHWICHITVSWASHRQSCRAQAQRQGMPPAAAAVHVPA